MLCTTRHDIWGSIQRHLHFIRKHPSVLFVAAHDVEDLDRLDRDLVNFFAGLVSVYDWAATKNSVPKKIRN